jgi:predicted NAD/FAD-dependent oxidoreductase
MNALGKHLAEDLDVRSGVRVAAPWRNGERWELQGEDGEALGSYDILVVSAPGPQTGDLLERSAPHLAMQAAAAEYDPAWALMLAFGDERKLPYDGLFFEDGGIAWAACNASKPGRRGNTWVIHATPTWTRSHLETRGEQVATELTSILAEQIGIDATGVIMASTHRWLYALARSPLESGTLWDPDLGLGVCGDWCRGARVEAAYLSGQAMAGRILGHLAGEATDPQDTTALLRAIGDG